MKELIVSLSLALGMGALVACGAGVNGDAATSENSATSAALSTLVTPMETDMSCSPALAAFFQVDLAAAEALVPHAYELVVAKSVLDGVTDVAQLTFTAIECGTFTWNGENYPTNMLMVTIDIVGPPGGEPVAGTGYGYVVLEQVTSPAFHAAVAGHGERAKLVKSIDLGGATVNDRQGMLVEANGNGLTWLEPQVVVLPQPILIPLNGVQYWQVGQGVNGAPVGGDTTCIEYVNGVSDTYGPHPLVLNADPRSEFGKLGLGTTLYGAAIDADLVTCTGHLYRIAKSN